MSGQALTVPDIRVTLLGRFAVTVGGVPVAEAAWKRRHAAAVVKVLALAPGRRLHREQVIDLSWPDDTITAAVPKLHKAAHYARHAIGVPGAVVLRGDQVLLCPGAAVTVDAAEFEKLARPALAEVRRGLAGHLVGGGAGRGARRGRHGHRRRRRGTGPAAVDGRPVPAGRPATRRRALPWPGGDTRPAAVAHPLGASRRGEQFKRDAVGVAERQARAVRRVHDLAVSHAELVQHGLDAEDPGVPRLADRQVGHGHGDVRDGGDGVRDSHDVYPLLVVAVNMPQRYEPSLPRTFPAPGGPGKVLK